MSRFEDLLDAYAAAVRDERDAAVQEDADPTHPAIAVANAARAAVLAEHQSVVEGIGRDAVNEVRGIVAARLAKVEPVVAAAKAVVEDETTTTWDALVVAVAALAAAGEKPR